MKNTNLCFLALCLSILSCQNTGHRNKKSNAEEKPNVVFLLVDDLGWKDLSSYGSSFYETPNIDRLAAKGIKFTRAYTPNPVCSPTRAAIMTGKYPSRVGITDWIPGDDPKNRKLLGPQDLDHMPLKEVTIAEALKEAGYKTFFAGKWHLGGEGYLPTDQGFNVNKGGFHYGQPPGGYYSPYHNEKLQDGPDGEYLTDRLTDESIRFIEENRDNPFYVHLAFYTVHTPIEANREYIEKFKKKKSGLKNKEPIKIKDGNGNVVQNQTNADYASMIYALDKDVGKLLDKLDSLDLTKRTLIIFTSDNGGLTSFVDERTAPTAVLPLRAGKGWAYEGGIRVPLIIKPPGGNRSLKQKVGTPVISMDLFPTILDYLKIPKRPQRHKDGKSLYNLIEKNEKFDRDFLFVHYPHYHDSGWTPGSALIEGDWKLVHFYENDSDELYNLHNDIGEQQDLSQKYPQKLDSLKMKLHQIIKATNSKLPIKN